MSQTNAIILRFRKHQAEQFEQMFKEEELPIWDDFIARKKFIRATLARVEGGSEGQEGIQDYILVVEVPSMKEHGEHDDDRRFQAFLQKARKLQPTSPLVWFGETIFQKP